MPAVIDESATVGAVNDAPAVAVNLQGGFFSPLISDATALGTLTDAVADALALLATNAAGTAARKVTITNIVRAILQATDAAGVRTAIGVPAGSGTSTGTNTGDQDLSGYALTSAVPGLAPVQSVAGRTGSVTLGVADVSGAATTTGTLGQFAATTSAQLAALLTDETGTGLAVFNTSPTLTTPTVSGTLTVSGGVTLSGFTANRVLYTTAGGAVGSDAEFTYTPGTQTLTVANIARSASYNLTVGNYAGTYGMQFQNFAVLFGTSGFSVGATTVSQPNTGVVRVGGTLSSTPVAWSITGTVNNANPGVARRYRLSGSSTPIVTGISISQVDGQECFVCNPNATAVQFNHQDAGSTAANRIICTGAANITLNQDEEACLWYDSTTSRWRMRKI